MGRATDSALNPKVRELHWAAGGYLPGRVRSPCQGYTLTWPGVRPRSQASVSGTFSQCSGWQLLAGQATVLSAHHFPYSFQLPSDEERDHHHHDNRQHLSHIAMPGTLPNAFT